jgi:hypothetical protein
MLPADRHQYALNTTIVTVFPILTGLAPGTYLLRNLPCVFPRWMFCSLVGVYTLSTDLLRSTQHFVVLIQLCCGVSTVSELQIVCR